MTDDELVEKVAEAYYEATRGEQYKGDPAYDWPNIDTGYDKPDDAIADPEWCRNEYRSEVQLILDLAAAVSR